MDEIRRVVRAASVRLWVLDFLRVLALTLTVGLSALLVTRIVEKLLGYAKDFAPLWPRIFLWTGVAVVVIAAAWSVLRRLKALAVARVVDERAGLRESLSTAMCVEKSPDPWAKAVIETAVEKARGVRIAEAIPMALPRYWQAPIGAGAALFIVWISLHDIDLTGRFKKQIAQDAKAREVVEVKEARAADKKALDDMLAKAGVDLKSEENGDGDGDASREQRELDPDAINRAAVKQLTDVSERLAQLKENEKNAQLDAMREALKQLKQPQDGPLNEFSRSLARGDFNKAQQALNEMSKQLAEGTMSPEQAAQAKEQMQNLAKQLEKLSKEQDELQKRLEQQGLDQKKAAEIAKKAMSNPEEMKKAIEELQNMSAEQKQQMMKMAQGMCEAMQASGEMSQAMQQMAQGMTQEGLQQEGQQGMEDLQDQLSQMENLQSDLENLDAALDEAKRQLEELGKCMGQGQGEGMGQPGESDGDGEQGDWRQGDSSNRGRGSGGPGRGDGSSRPMEEADFQVEKKKANSQTTQGQIIGSRLVYGQQVKGESVAEFAAAVEAGSKSAAEAMETQTVAREYHGPLKTYFGRLQSKIKADKAAPTGPGAPAAKDAPAPQK